ncbi:MAG: hypothetical protein K5910_01460 [Bacteroidales bacterium]|nr:hypothetical protein [Bacteroidales bacterium]
MKRFFLVTTDHLKDRLWFRDKDDFTVAMTYVAVAAFVTGCTVIAFILMSNHVHFVLYCEREKADAFIQKFKRLYAAYYQKKYSVGELLRRNGIDIQEVRREDESLERAIAYVLMNCVAANICLEPTGYPWSSADVFFNQSPLVGVSLKDLSGRKQRSLLKSRVVLPEDYLLSPKGYILPRSYIDRRWGNTIFHSPKRLNYFLRTSSKARLRLEGNAAPAFRDQIILAACKDLCQTLFRADTLSALDKSQQAEMLRQLVRRFNADINQLCRVTGIPYAEAARLLDGI